MTFLDFGNEGHQDFEVSKNGNVHGILPLVQLRGEVAGWSTAAQCEVFVFGPESERSKTDRTLRTPFELGRFVFCPKRKFVHIRCVFSNLVLRTFPQTSNSICVRIFTGFETFWKCTVLLFAISTHCTLGGTGLTRKCTGLYQREIFTFSITMSLPLLQKKKIKGRKKTEKTKHEAR